jgi:hypothetical protein
MELPITDKELFEIMELVKNKNNQLYNKLWTYRMSTKIKEGVK